MGTEFYCLFLIAHERKHSLPPAGLTLRVSSSLKPFLTLLLQTEGSMSSFESEHLNPSGSVHACTVALVSLYSLGTGSPTKAPFPQGSSLKAENTRFHLCTVVSQHGAYHVMGPWKISGRNGWRWRVREVVGSRGNVPSFDNGWLLFYSKRILDLTLTFQKEKSRITCPNTIWPLSPWASISLCGPNYSLQDSFLHSHGSVRSLRREKTKPLGNAVSSPQDAC